MEWDDGIVIYGIRQALSAWWNCCLSMVAILLRLLMLSPLRQTRLLYLLNYGIWVPYHWLSAAILARLVDPTKVPAHIAVIMDGNRRFAHSIGLPSIKLGHEQGAEKLREFLEWCLRYENIREVTVWALSIDNLSGRHPREIADLWDLCEEHLPQFSAQNQDALRQRGVSVRVIGERNLLPQRILAIVRDLEEKTHLNDPRIVLNIALPYGGREEIVAAATAKGPARISEGLYTKSSPDLIIRSGGERRLSGFLLWQSAHAELYFSSQLWPCFSQSHFLFALFDFQQRQRRFGR